MEQTKVENKKEYSINVIISRPKNPSRRMAVLALLFIPRFIMLILHFVVLYFLAIISFLVTVFGQFAVLFTSRYPEGTFDIVRGVVRWQLRINMYMLGA